MYQKLSILVLFMIGGTMAHADESQEYRVVIPKEVYTIVEFKQHGLPGKASINSALITFEPKVVFRWHLSIMIAAQDLEENKMPTPNEEKVLEQFQDQLDLQIKANGNALFLGEVTNDGWRELLYRVYNPEPVNTYLQDLISSKTHLRPFDYRIDEDKDWEKTQWHLNAASR